jgi:hypothetical protein
MDPDVNQGLEKEERPTFKWVACLAVGLLITIASASLVETRGDIKDIKITNTIQDSRLSAIEASGEVQFNAIKQWKIEIREDLRTISVQLADHERNTRKFGGFGK